jgi:hypothetical protein
MAGSQSAPTGLACNRGKALSWQCAVYSVLYHALVLVYKTRRASKTGQRSSGTCTCVTSRPDFGDGGPEYHSQTHA